MSIGILKVGQRISTASVYESHLPQGTQGTIVKVDSLDPELPYEVRFDTGHRVWRSAKDIVPIEEPSSSSADAASPPAPLFQRLHSRGAEIVREIVNQRANEYGDSWGQCRFDIAAAQLKREGLPELTREQHQRLCLAYLCDTKLARLIGEPKDDTVQDLAAYLTALAGSGE